MSVRERGGEALRDETAGRADPGSFRDPANQVYYDADGQVLRTIRGAAAVADWRALAATGFFGRLTGEGAICPTEEIAAASEPAASEPAASEPAASEPAASEPAAVESVTLRHERIPFISYPYEWTFSMLRDAAVRHLDVLLAALAEGITTKDGSAYNLQWRGTVPAFIDIGSFERMREGEPWAGYRQFCQTMLYPLLLTAHLGVPFQPWLRAQIDGIEAPALRPLFRGARRWKAGVFRHIHLHDAMQRRFASASSGEVRDQLRDAGLSTELVVATVRGLRRLVHRLDWQPPASHWAGYRETCSYSDADRDAKLAFVEAALGELRAGGDELGLVLDLGANDGAYSRLAARHARAVVAVESDPAVTDALYRSVRDGADDRARQRILPIVMDLADPSPGGGWRGVERASFPARSGADAVLALAVVHHLAIGRNVPLPEVVASLAELGRAVVVEFVEPTDPMAQRLLANKPAGMFGGYHRDGFERALAERFTVVRRAELPSGARTLYAGVPRG